ncbi:MAG: RNA methyltransferase [Clostridia bacterium]|nr:RNA methyltransferase [Clostridia bacterium]
MKERDRFVQSNIFEGIVSFRAVISTIINKTSDRKIEKVYYDVDKLSKKGKEFSFIKAKSYELGYEIETVDKSVIDELTLGNSHGGLAFVCSERTYPALSEELIEEKGFYVCIDGIEDPYNFGYALRSLCAAGVDGIILSKRNWLGASGVVCRASAGASEELPIFISDDESYVDTFKNKGYKLVCADMENSVSMYDANLKKPLLLIVGGEKRGISRTVLEKADTIVSIDYGRDFPAALSAASASTVLAFEIFRQNKQ